MKKKKCDCKNKGFVKCVNEEKAYCEHRNDLGDSGYCDICSDKVWKDAVNESKHKIKMVYHPDELPSIYSDDAPPHMQMRMLWNKVNEIIKILNKHI